VGWLGRGRGRSAAGREQQQTGRAHRRLEEAAAGERTRGAGDAGVAVRHRRLLGPSRDGAEPWHTWTLPTLAASARIDRIVLAFKGQAQLSDRRRQLPRTVLPGER